MTSFRQYTLDYLELTWLRKSFLNAVHREAPEVFQDLSHSVLPTYVRYVGTFSNVPWGDGLLWSKVKERAKGGCSASLALESRLTYWADEYRLSPKYFIPYEIPTGLLVISMTDREWVFHVALSSLHHWHTSPVATQNFPLATLGTSWRQKMSIQEMRITFDSYEWDPGFSSRRHLRERILQQVMSRLDKRLDEIEATFREHHPDWEKAKRTKTLNRDLEWLVRHHIKGVDFGDLASIEDEDPDTQPETDTIRKAVQRTAHKVGLLLKPSQT